MYKRSGDVAAKNELTLWSAVCVKTQNDAGIYNSCWYLRFMLVFTIHAGIYTSYWYTHTHETTTVTLAALARRGLMYKEVGMLLQKMS